MENSLFLALAFALVQTCFSCTCACICVCVARMNRVEGPKHTDNRWQQPLARIQWITEVTLFDLSQTLLRISRMAKTYTLIVIGEFQALQGGKQQSWWSYLQTGERGESTVCCHGLTWCWNIAADLSWKCQSLLRSSYWCSISYRPTTKYLNRCDDDPPIWANCFYSLYHTAKLLT